jgi:hypothetical protein
LESYRFITSLLNRIDILQSKRIATLFNATKRCLTRIESASVGLGASLQATSQGRGKALAGPCTRKCSTACDQRIKRSALARPLDQLFFAAKTLRLTLQYSCALRIDSRAFFSRYQAFELGHLSGQDIQIKG